MGAVILGWLLVCPWAAGERAGSAAPAKTIRGKILAVRLDTNIVILDVGEVQGAKVGEVYRVFREDQFVAAVRVRELFPEMAAADIETKAVDIRVGDEMVNQLLVEDSSKVGPVPEPPAGKSPDSKRSHPKMGQVLIAQPLVAFNLGSAEGVRPGSKATIARGDKWIGTVTAIRVREHVTVAEVETRKADFAVGDSVLFWPEAGGREK
jgi:hypothetical protein